MHLLTDKGGESVWINNSVENYGCSCEFPTEIIAKAYMEWAICHYSVTRDYKWAKTMDDLINMRNKFISLISTCLMCKKDLDNDEIDNVLIELSPKRSQWYDFVMRCENCIEKEGIEQ